MPANHWNQSKRPAFACNSKTDKITPWQSLELQPLSPSLVMAIANPIAVMNCDFGTPSKRRTVSKSTELHGIISITSQPKKIHKPFLLAQGSVHTSER
mmetsp:Transcript_3153/g.6969  ORF Transcript_3153/g.6969 Transcript_3153/m.6969 type:complete len:98 (+) Transcript_3153:220-513(+)